MISHIWKKWPAHKSRLSVITIAFTEPRDLDLDDDLELLHQYDDDEGEHEPGEVAMRDAAAETDDSTKEESERKHNVGEDGDDLEINHLLSFYGTPVGNTWG